MSGGFPRLLHRAWKELVDVLTPPIWVWVIGIGLYGGLNLEFHGYEGMFAKSGGFLVIWAIVNGYYRFSVSELVERGGRVESQLELNRLRIEEIDADLDKEMPESENETARLEELKGRVAKLKDESDQTLRKSTTQNAYIIEFGRDLFELEITLLLVGTTVNVFADEIILLLDFLASPVL